MRNNVLWMGGKDKFESIIARYSPQIAIYSHLAMLTMAPKEYMMANPVMFSVHSNGMDWRLVEADPKTNYE
jgi:diphthamide synthase (EF-2-diphthine--ammonia ligase)